MTEETRPEQDTIEGVEAHTSGPDTGPLPDLPDSAYGEDAVPLSPAETDDDDVLTDEEASLAVDDPSEPSPYDEDTAQEVQS